MQDNNIEAAAHYQDYPAEDGEVNYQHIDSSQDSYPDNISDDDYEPTMDTDNDEGEQDYNIRDDRPTCQQCGKSFSSNGTLNRHMRSVHKNRAKSKQDKRIKMRHSVEPSESQPSVSTADYNSHGTDKGTSNDVKQEPNTNADAEVSSSIGKLKSNALILYTC